MSNITGEVVAQHDGKTYRLYLGMRGIGLLQQEFGKDIAPIFAEADASGTAIPDMSALLRVVEVSLHRHHPDADEYTAGDLLGADLSLPGRLIHATFPDAVPDNSPAKQSGRSTGKRKARR